MLDTRVRGEVSTFIEKKIEEDLKLVEEGKYPSLLGKWLPSENASSYASKHYSRILITDMHISAREYRKKLVKLRNAIRIVETMMSTNKWKDIDFNNLPGKALLKYRSAFKRHLSEEFEEYLDSLANGEGKVNTSALFPVDIVSKILRKVNYEEIKLLDGAWKDLPNWFEGKEETGICVVDTSGSMEGTPMDVAISLGIYCADKCKGPFKNHFITFSRRPELQEVKGDTIVDKVKNLEQADWDMNTNLEAVFDLILDTAIINKAEDKDMPQKLYIISDMQFDYAATRGKITFMQKMKNKYLAAGYTMPSVVYWNVSARNTGLYQDTVDGENICFVSGYSPVLFKNIIEGTKEVEVIENGRKIKKYIIDPLYMVEHTLLVPRYDCIVTEE